MYLLLIILLTIKLYAHIDIFKTMVTAFTVSELLRENQQGRRGCKNETSSSPRLGLYTKQSLLLFDGISLSFLVLIFATPDVYFVIQLP